jgi:hypothetical protein
MSLVIEIAVVIAAAAAIAVCLERLPVAAAAPWRRARRPTAVRPQPLAAAERLVSMSEVSALTLHAHLRPVLMQIAARRLAARGYVLEAMDQDTGAQLLGAGLWDLVRPDRPFPEDRHGRGIPVGELASMLTVLEQL